MKLIILSSLSLTILGHSITPYDNIPSWPEFKQKFNKIYSKNEENVRLENFLKTVAFVKSHNEKFLKGQETYFTAINSHADMSDAEFHARNNYNENADGASYACLTQYEPSQETDSSCLDCYDVDENDKIFSWADANYNPDGKNYQVAVKDQGACGSCWAFAGAATLEGKLCQAGVYDCNTWTGISEQNYVDCLLCDENYENEYTGLVCDYGCGGGWSQDTWYSTKIMGGVDNEDSYPYTSGSTGQETTCDYKLEDSVFPDDMKIENTCTKVEYKNEAALMDALNQVGSIKVSIYASESGFRSYAGGVYSSTTCPQSTNHAVTAVGYGTMKVNGEDQDYWMIKNSWGTSWGLDGYIKMARNNGNQCCVACYAYWPTIG